MDVWEVPNSSCPGLDSGPLMDVGPKHARHPATAHSRGIMARLFVDCRGGAAGRNRPAPVPGLWTKGIRPVTLAAGGNGGPHAVPARAVAGARRLPACGRRLALGIERHPVSLHLAPQRQET